MARNVLDLSSRWCRPRPFFFRTLAIQDIGQLLGLPPMKNVNSDIAYDFLRKRILSGHYLPGTALMTNALSPEIGVSRTPIRDALRQLEQDGLVTIQARAGARVKQMELREFREVCEMRLALETHAAGLAAKRRADADLQQIRIALDEMRSLTEK